jgi:hypothetical protein
VVNVAHLTTAEMMSVDAIAEMENSFDEMARDLRGLALPGPRADVADVPREVILSHRRVTGRGRPA